MTAISVKVYKSSPTQKKPHRLLLEVLVRSLIILCTLLSIILSSIAVCDGNWLQTSGGRVFGLWRFCTMEPMQRVDGRITAGHNNWSPPRCITKLGESDVEGVVEVGIICCRALLTLAVVAAIFGLEFQVISRLSKGEDSARRWILGSVLMLGAAAASASGLTMFVVLLRGFVGPVSLTLTFWCQITAVFLFFLNGMAARQIHDTNIPSPLSSTLQKC
ncbi:voltage-dependent calcium channel gamma-like subunit [Symphorus nematophorus]